MTSPPPATVYLVGAGPGDPGLITLKGAECLARADIVLYDYLVNPATLQHANHNAELVQLGQPRKGRSFTPGEIEERMVTEALAGRTVVRLKGGDPSVFGRGADETKALRRAGIPYEIVPGITTGLAAAAYAEIPVTHHEDASAVALIAGRERDAKSTSQLDFNALADFPGTLIFYMAVGKAADWSTALIEHGKPPDTPVAVVRWCSRAEQETHRCTLATVVDLIDQEEIRPPAVFVVGSVVRHAPDLSWFQARPLFGVRILLPGSPATTDKLSARLMELGAAVVAGPTIEICDPPDWAPVDEALGRLQTYDWLVFSSANGVEFFFGRLRALGADVRRLGGVRIAAMGSGTADRLAALGISADLVPDEFVAESLAKSLVAQSGGGRFLLPRASRGRQVLAEQLTAAGAEVDQIVTYASVDREKPDPIVARELAEGRIDWVAVASASAARSLVHLYGESIRSARLASIGPVTSSTLRDLGFQEFTEAAPHSTGGLVDAILRGING